MTEVIAEASARGAAGDPVRPELRRRCGARAARRGHACRGDEAHGDGARARARLGDVPALSFDRRARSRDRRRRQERARDRCRHRRRPRARRERRRRAGDARLRRAVSLRPRLRRAARDVDRLVRARRRDPHLLERTVAQLSRSASRSGRAIRRRPGQLAEGIFTAPVLFEMAKEQGIDMPIASAVVDILVGRASVDEATEAC